VHVLVMTTVWK